MSISQNCILNWNTKLQKRMCLPLGAFYVRSRGHTADSGDNFMNASLFIQTWISMLVSSWAFMSLKCTMGPIHLQSQICLICLILLINNDTKRMMSFSICSRQKSISFNGRNAKIQIWPWPVFWSDHWPLKVVRSTVNIIVAFKTAFNLMYVNTYLPNR